MASEALRLLPSEDTKDTKKSKGIGNIGINEVASVELITFFSAKTINSLNHGEH